MNIWERLRPSKKDREFKAPVTGQEAKPIKKEKRKPEQGQLLQILSAVKADPRIYQELSEQLYLRNTQKFKSKREAERYIDSATTSQDAAGVAKLIDRTFGKGTFRTLSFLDRRQDASRSVHKLLRYNIENTSFEKQAEKGLYLNLLESYGVQWNLEKVGRDSLQNFFDANGQTLEGIDIQTSIEDREDPMTPTPKKSGRVLIQGGQDYDWKELIHFGGTTKADSDTAVGGFGEGLKISAFVLLRDFGATKVKAGSRDWEINYYLGDVASDAYRQPTRGLYAKKSARENRGGNYLEIIFEGDNIEEKVKTFENAKGLFYSKENPDFENPSFNSRVGGFCVLQPPPNARLSWDFNRKGHLYLAGQRTHYDSRDKWETVENVNIWTWTKVQLKDRDRGMITLDEMQRLVIPPIVESMSIEEATKSVYDFQELWEHLNIYSVGNRLLESIVNRLAEQQVKLEFPAEFLADNIPYGYEWIREAMKTKGFKMAPNYMEKIGMKTAVEQFTDLQSHSRVEASPTEQKRIDLLKEAATKIGLEEDEIKDVWIFSEEDEKNIFSGQYNGLFYWLSRESLSQDFFETLNLYVHEAAHKRGTHGKAEFEYYLEQCKQKITKFIMDHRDEWDELDRQWKEIASVRE